MLDCLLNTLRDKPLADPRNRARTGEECPGDFFIRPSITAIALIGQQENPRVG